MPLDPTEHPFGDEARNILEADISNNEKPIQVFVGPITEGGVDFFHLRKTYYDRSAQMRPGKGLTLPYEPELILEVLHTAIEVFNLEFGTNLAILELEE